MSVNNKLIIKNSIALYIRMLLSMIISLYTTRVVLNTLGASDFGLYSVVAGIITIFAVLKGLIASGTQRFLAFELGRGGEKQRMRDVFSTSYTLFVIIGGIIFILAETIGLWFVNNYLQIPHGRLLAANIVYQVSILSMLVSIVHVPYTASILAHERMDIYGYTGIIEPVIRLVFVLMLPILPWDKLIVYSVLMFVNSFLMTCFYVVYCNRLFDECSLKLFINKAMKTEILSFTTWNLLEVVSNESNNQGQNVLINMFFGPIVNASRAVSTQVNNAVHGFASNFVVAVIPQITKSYAGNDIKNFVQLIIRGSKFAYIVLALIMIPIIININFILNLWLEDPPEYASIFCILILIAMLVRMISEPLYTGIQATGKIKKYQIVTNSLTLLNLPICYFLFKIGRPAYDACIVSILMSAILVFSRLFFLTKLTNFPYKEYLKTIVCRCISVSIILFAISYYINSLFEKSLFEVTVFSIGSVICNIIVFFFFSLSYNERLFFTNFIKSKLKIA